MARATVRLMRPNASQYVKWLILSDTHSIHLDARAFAVALGVYADNPFDRLVILGDLVDAAALSSHPEKFSGRDRAVSWAEEIDFTRDRILAPIAAADAARPGRKPTKVVLPGNHCDRAMRVQLDNQRATAEVTRVSLARGTADFAALFGLKEFGFRLCNGQAGDGIVTIGREQDAITLLHGVRCGVGRLKQNIATFGSHVVTGHTHKFESCRVTHYRGHHLAIETGCLRTIRNVEYLPVGAVPGWSHGFVTIWIHRSTGRAFLKQHEISIDYRCEYKGKIYAA